MSVLKIKYTELLIFIVSAELVGALSALITGDFASFFDRYVSPPLMPPSWLFPVVWAVLYALMGISAYLIYFSNGGADKKRALWLYAAQLAVNFSWSIVFFKYEKLWAGAAVIILLIVPVMLMITFFKKISPTVARLNIPYLLWLIFAAYLNIATAIING